MMSSMTVLTRKKATAMLMTTAMSTTTTAIAVEFRFATSLVHHWRLIHLCPLAIADCEAQQPKERQRYLPPTAQSGPSIAAPSACGASIATPRAPPSAFRDHHTARDTRPSRFPIRFSPALFVLPLPYSFYPVPIPFTHFPIRFTPSLFVFYPSLFVLLLPIRFTRSLFVLPIPYSF